MNFWVDFSCPHEGKTWSAVFRFHEELLWELACAILTLIEEFVKSKGNLMRRSWYGWVSCQAPMRSEGR